MQGPTVSHHDLNVSLEYEVAFTQLPELDQNNTNQQCPRNPIQRSNSTPARERPAYLIRPGRFRASSRPAKFRASSRPDLRPTAEEGQGYQKLEHLEDLENQSLSQLDNPAEASAPPHTPVYRVPTLPSPPLPSTPPPPITSPPDLPNTPPPDLPRRRYSTGQLIDAPTQTSGMKLRGPNKVSRTKTIPFLLIAVFMLLLGVALIAVGLLIEFKWKYEMEVFYNPSWAGGFVTIAGIFVSVFCCLRTPTVAVVVTSICLPALAASIIQLVFSGLMAEALAPDENKFFCVSRLLQDNTTLRCECNEGIAYNITVKGGVPISTTSAFCEDEIVFVFELMLAVACVCAILILIFFPYIMWSFCTVTRPTYAEKRNSMFNGTMTRSGTLLHIQNGTIPSPLVLSNSINRHNSSPPSRPSSRTASRAQSINSNGFRPVVTVQRSQTFGQSPLIHNGTVRSTSGTLKSARAPQPPAQAVAVRGSPYRSIERNLAREQSRFEIPADIQGVRPTIDHMDSRSSPPVQMAKLLSKSRNSRIDDGDSSDDNTADVVHNFKSSPKQMNVGPGGKAQNLSSNLDISDYAKT